MPQTRFVLKKSLELGIKPIVVINKIDKPAADPARAEEQVLELFLELGANDEQSNFPVVYAIGKQGIAKSLVAKAFDEMNPAVLQSLKKAITTAKDLTVNKGGLLDKDNPPPIADYFIKLFDAKSELLGFDRSFAEHLPCPAAARVARRASTSAWW